LTTGAVTHSWTDAA